MNKINHLFINKIILLVFACASFSTESLFAGKRNKDRAASIIQKHAPIQSIPSLLPEVTCCGFLV